jgi:hypothetical protein
LRRLEGEAVMVKVGERIWIESEKVGVEPRTGLVVGVDGTLVRVQWDDGHESSITPTAGAMRTEPS